MCASDDDLRDAFRFGVIGANVEMLLDWVDRMSVYSSMAGTLVVAFAVLVALANTMAFDLTLGVMSVFATMVPRFVRKLYSRLLERSWRHGERLAVARWRRGFVVAEGGES